MAYGYPVTPQAIGEALVRYQPVNLQVPKVAQQSGMSRIGQQAGSALDAWSDRNRQSRPSGLDWMLKNPADWQAQLSPYNSGSGSVY